ncbi:MAG: carbonic anhydrase [Halobacteriota archaeon]|nr:carbonic anhydrase [Halobacteriota archaeon]
MYDRPKITTADEAWEELMKGNKRYVAGESTDKDLVSRRIEVESGQDPFVTVITCSDSRVPPELLFDQGLGDIFVIRTAGNVVGPIALGSIEYGVEHLHTPLLVILGHQHCGAVTTAVEGEAEGNIGTILKEIHPAVDTARGSKKEGEKLVEEAVKENIRLVIQNTLKESRVVHELYETGDLKIIGAKYFLDSGKVEIIEELSWNK